MMRPCHNNTGMIIITNGQNCDLWVLISNEKRINFRTFQETDTDFDNTEQECCYNL